ncbi:MAG: hypothetical protein ABJC87_18775 [Roseobacter sp.]
MIVDIAKMATTTNPRAGNTYSEGRAARDLVEHRELTGISGRDPPFP